MRAATYGASSSVEGVRIRQKAILRQVWTIHDVGSRLDVAFAVSDMSPTAERFTFEGELHVMMTAIECIAWAQLATTQPMPRLVGVLSCDVAMRNLAEHRYVTDFRCANTSNTPRLQRGAVLYVNFVSSKPICEYVPAPSL